MSAFHSRVLVMAAVVGASGSFAEEAEPASGEVGDVGDVEEVVVTEQRLEPGNLNPISIQRLRDANGKGARLYRHGRYGKAFPHLLAAAKSGFKLAQARVGYIYQEGLGGIQRDAFAAIGWMGVAATHETTPEILAHFKAMMQVVPDQFKPKAEAIVADYRVRYGSEAAGIHCEKQRAAGTHISRLKCVFDNEFDFRDGIDSALIGDLLAVPIPPPDEN